MAWTGDKKAFCFLEFAKTESVVTVQRRFRTMYHTEPPMDKTIREWYMKFQQSGCLCAAETVERVRESCQEPSEVNTSREPVIADASVKCLARSAQTSSRERIPATDVAGDESEGPQSSFALPTAAGGTRVC